MTAWVDNIHVGDCRELLAKMAGDGVKAQMVVTSPPYWGLRSYGKGKPNPKMMGLEPTLELYLANLVHAMDLVWDVLEPNGTLWLNLGDTSVSTGGSGFQGKHGNRATRTHTQRKLLEHRKLRVKLAPKNLMMIPARVAIALQESGWILRSKISWEKPNCMPESAKDRPTNCLEEIFLFAKQRHYYYDGAAVKEKASELTHARTKVSPVGVAPDQPRSRPQGKRSSEVSGWKKGPGSHSTVEHTAVRTDMKDGTKFGREAGWRERDRIKANDSFHGSTSHDVVTMRNMRNLWRFPTEAFHGDHFATFPRELPTRCILAGSKAGDVILDPFMGTGTTAEAAMNLGRKFIGFELNEDDLKNFKKYRSQQTGMAI